MRFPSFPKAISQSVRGKIYFPERLFKGCVEPPLRLFVSATQEVDSIFGGWENIPKSKRIH